MFFGRGNFSWRSGSINGNNEKNSKFRIINQITPNLCLQKKTPPQKHLLDQETRIAHKIYNFIFFLTPKDENQI